MCVGCFTGSRRRLGRRRQFTDNAAGFSAHDEIPTGKIWYSVAPGSLPNAVATDKPRAPIGTYAGFATHREMAYRRMAEPSSVTQQCSAGGR
jgi:hypothetical protein